MTAFDQMGLLDGADQQFRLTRIQLFNWGTFSGITDFAIPEAGYLLVGASGSGKSTILDAHAAILTPPKWVAFNVAAGASDRNSRDRNPMSYIRGAYALETGDNGEFVSRYLRTSSTWSAISETFRSADGRCVTLVQVLWAKGISTAPGDAKRLFLVLEREFELQELEFFAKADFDVRRFKHDLADADVYQEFSAYQDRFRRLLGVDNERALRLLHKTQSAKDLGDLNVFLRDFMLDEPGTFKIADRLVNEFGELNAAHQSVVAARQQIEVLVPARLEQAERDKAAFDRNGLQAQETAVDQYREYRRKLLLDDRIKEVAEGIDAQRQKSQALGIVVQDEAEALAQLQSRRLGMGANILAQLEKEIDTAEGEKPLRLSRRGQVDAACKVMGWEIPNDVVWFVKRVAEARERVAASHEADADAEARKDGLKEQVRQTDTEFRATVTEVRALQSQPSNLPSRLLNLRQTMAEHLGLPEDKLPFVGELLEVKPEEADWQGAIERVLGGFARSLLVEDRHHGAVSAYLNGRHIGERLAYFRVLKQVSGSRAPGPTSLVHKLKVAPGPYADWLREELKAHFDIECASTMQAFAGASRAVTQQGLLKYNAIRHEKNDRNRIDDRTNWVLGFDNKAKRALFEMKAFELGKSLTALQAALKQVKEEDAQRQVQLLHCQTLSNLTWSEIDVGALVTRIDELKKRVEAERAARPDLARMEELIAAQAKVHKAATDRKNEEDALLGQLQLEFAGLQEKLEEVLRSYPTADRAPAFAEELAARYERADRTGRITLDSLDPVTSLVERALRNDVRTLDSRIAELKNAIVQRFADFNRRWPEESGDHDASLESAPDFFAKLQRLETDGLPRFEAKFLTMFREQSDQNLAMLSATLDQERAAIRARMALVNESLRGAPFNKGTHLVIRTADKTLDDVRLFRAALKESLSHTYSLDATVAEQQFLVLARMVKRLGSQETVDRNWRALVLDVRQHVEFVAYELLDTDNSEVEVYRSGAGKSGGQRQKLTSTCLAAALRYQLGGKDRALPSFSTVVLDEAFDKADAEFTSMSMNIFKAFGFQMIVATPLKSVMTLEPFIGGACFVSIKDRKHSTVHKVEYDTEAKRLRLPTVQATDVPHGEETPVA